jgi:hypothetical protein
MTLDTSAVLKGRHAVGLNLGDCASYALAQWSGEPCGRNLKSSRKSCTACDTRAEPHSTRR